MPWGRLDDQANGNAKLLALSDADWRMVLFGMKDWRGSVDDVNAAYKQLARTKHPDVAKDDGAAMAHLNRARDYALAELQ